MGPSPGNWLAAHRADLTLMTNSLKLSYHYRGPPRCFGEQGKKSNYLRETGEQTPNFEGNRGTKTILGNREHDNKFSIFGEQGNKPIYFRGTREQVNPPLPLGGPHYPFGTNDCIAITITKLARNISAGRKAVRVRGIHLFQKFSNKRLFEYEKHESLIVGWFYNL